jgi:hypothetical protein
LYTEEDHDFYTCPDIAKKMGGDGPGTLNSWERREM